MEELEEVKQVVAFGVTAGLLFLAGEDLNELLLILMH